MSTNGKMLLTIWLTALAVFGLTVTYIVPQDSTINAPGELGEAFSTAGLVVILALTVISGIVWFHGKRK